jgi:hypothetical protein
MMDYQNVFISSTILLRAGVQAGELLRPMRTVVINSAYGTMSSLPYARLTTDRTRSEERDYHEESNVYPDNFAWHCRCGMRV